MEDQAQDIDGQLEEGQGAGVLERQRKRGHLQDLSLSLPAPPEQFGGGGDVIAGVMAAGAVVGFAVPMPVRRIRIGGRG